jgi:hypothetical protein
VLAYIGWATGAAGGIGGGSGVVHGVAKWTFGVGVVVSTTLRGGLSVAGVGVGVSTTLRGGRSVGSGIGVVGTALLVMEVAHRPVSNSVRFCEAVTWLLVMGAKGEPGDGCGRAVVMSCRAARMRSLEEARGMVTFVGNQEMVSEICSARVSNIQIV